MGPTSTVAVKKRKGEDEICSCKRTTVCSGIAHTLHGTVDKLITSGRLAGKILLLLHLQWCKLHLLWPNFWHATCGSNECHRLAVHKDKEWRTSFFHRSQRRRKCNFCVSFSLRWQHDNEHVAAPVVIFDGCSCCYCSLCCCYCCYSGCCGCKCCLPLLLR